MCATNLPQCIPGGLYHHYEYAPQAAVLVRRLRSGLEAALEQLMGGGGGRGHNAAGLGGSSLVNTAARVLEAEEAALQRDRA